ncbi:hypothetical protein GCM10009740_21690 [Terrabacter terrae]|uniref:Uncharacterized protein n=1 Tax=Terrabacter terrae TaxID=318434 RepID=A0ABP5FPQ3_9MICO
MAPVPEDDAARPDPSTREGSHPGTGRDTGSDTGSAVVAAGGAGDAAALQGSLPAAAAASVRWVGVVATLVAAGALLVAQHSGYAATLGVTLVLALALAWGWPLLTGSYTPAATTLVLAVAGVAIVLSALRQDLLWVPAAVAFGIVLSFFGQLVRRSGREGLVLTLLSSFGGLVVVASATSAVVAANSDRGRAVAVVALAAVGAAVVGDLLAGARALARALPLVALLAAVVAAMVAAARVGQVGVPEALGIGAVAGVGSWSFRRLFALAPAMVTTRGQVGAATGSVLAVGAVIHLFAAIT